MYSELKKSVLLSVFLIAVGGLTLLFVILTYIAWVQNKKERIQDLSYTSQVIRSYYELSFHQWEHSLMSVGQRLIDIKGEDAAIRRLEFANESIKYYKELLAFGFANPEGKVITFTGLSLNDSLPHLMASENSRRSFLAARESRGLSIGESYYFENVRDWILPIRVPIRDEEGNLLAVNTSAIDYSSLNEELESFGFNKNYRIHLINSLFNTTQIYYPLEFEKYKDILRKEADIYSNLKINTDWGIRYFEAYNTYENHQVIGIRSSLSDLDHDIVVFVKTNILWNFFWRDFRVIFIGYLTILLTTAFLFIFFRRKEKDYLLELQNERDYSTNLINSSPTLIVGLTKDHSCKFVNPSTLKNIEYSWQEIIGKDFWKLLLPNELYDQAEILFSHLKKGDVKDYEITHITKNGNKKVISWDFRYESNDGGLLGFGKDITEEKVATEKLLEREANLKSIFESTNSIIGLFDKNHNLIEFNQSFAEYARKTDDLVLYPGMDILNKMKRPEVVSQFKTWQKKALKGEKFKETIEYKSPEGIVYFLFNYNPIYQNGEITGVSMFVEDITELKRAQKELLKYTENLENIVAVRTEELEVKNKELEKGNFELEKTLNNLKETQQQLVQAEKMASLGILAAGIGHEINNPLNFIKNGVIALTNQLKKYQNLPDEDLKPFIDIINEGINRSTNIVKSLSHFSRRGVSFNETCDIHEIIENCLTILQNRLKNKVKVIKNFCGEEVKMKGSEGKLHQAFLNIISNAEQAIESSGTIEIKTIVYDQNIFVEIKDTGCGISDENLTRIGDPFFTTKAPGQGTGLGLFITYSILEEHHGAISVESQLNKGTIFTVKLPTKST